VPFDFKRLGLPVPAILISPWFKQAVDSTMYSHSTIPGTIIDALQLPGGSLTERDKGAAKLTQKYLIDDGSHTWRQQTPDVAVPMQPRLLDAMQREILDGSVHVDPDPAQQDTNRTQDIRDPAQAKQFVRTQMAKRLSTISRQGAGPCRQLPLAMNFHLPWLVRHASLSCADRLGHRVRARNRGVRSPRLRGSLSELRVCAESIEGAKPKTSFRTGRIVGHHGPSIVQILI
jgi:hypothetical protein